MSGRDKPVCLSFALRRSATSTGTNRENPSGRCTARAKRKFSLLLVLACCAMPLGLAGADDFSQNPASPRGKVEEIINFALLDHRGQSHELRRADARAVVIFFTGNGCPIA